MAIAVDGLSNEHDIVQAYKTIGLRLNEGHISLHGTLEIVRLRIEAETQFTNSLRKIIESFDKLLSVLNENETLRMYGFDALHTDFKNEYKQRIAFLNSLKHDVEKPVASTKQMYHTQYKYFTNQSKLDLKSLKQQHRELVKLKEKYHKVMSDEKYRNKRQLLINTKTKYKQHKVRWKKQQKQYDNKMETALQSMKNNECERMQVLRDAVTNWSAFITNLCANRKYDIADLTKSMALIQVDEDLHMFMRRTRFSIYGL